MCAVIGAILVADNGPDAVDQVNETLATIFNRSTERGRDGYGWAANTTGGQVFERCTDRFEALLLQDTEFFDLHVEGPASLIGNLRAEPTTEYVAVKHESDQQPYQLGRWTIVHNGTIANDKLLRLNKLTTRIDSAAIVEQLAAIETDYPNLTSPGEVFVEMTRRLKGSYAILAVHDSEPGVIYAACNYRPIWWASDCTGTFFASSRTCFPDHMRPLMVPPYSVWRYDESGGVGLTPATAVQPSEQRALVVCSGGLDSVVAATKMIRDGYRVTLLHFRYGSRAEGPEIAAFLAVAEELGVRYWTPAMDIYQTSDSPLLQADSKIAGGETGAEFAYEWVPARNLVMLSIAVAMAEAKGFDLVVLGNNLEEAGAYPDNEPEFIARFNDLLPFAVADGKQVRVVMPVGNLMKHEIVALGLELDAPLHLTWSCYRAGTLHCGVCGPCLMRRTAFEINGADEVIQYDEGNR
jgi:7-cyano-7-deazaguanine synthase